ncbi:MAG: hypothetical protein U0K60_00060 [Parafannyhessea umbonata]|nr:hypothetical protein [Parafannyhessea umbonata]
MDLTYTDAAMHDVGVLNVTGGDFAWGADENDFELTLADWQESPEIGGLVYADGTDIWGVVRGAIRTDDGKVKAVGATWTGALDSRILKPPSGSAYFRVSGDMRDCVASLISQLGCADLFAVAKGKTGITVTHTFQGREGEKDTGRYMGGWSALWQITSEHGCKAVARYDADARKIVLTIGRTEDRTDTEDMESAGASVALSNTRPVNHLVCLGQGEGTARTVLDLYMDSRGKVSTNQTYRGLDEIAEVYDDGNAEDAAALQSDGTARLKEYWDASQSVSMDVDADVYDLGDLVGGTDPTTGINATAIVTKKVLTFSDGIATVSYETTVR